MIDDDGSLEGDYALPAAYPRLFDATGTLITVRVTGTAIATAPRLAFGPEFQRLSDIFGQRYLQLWDLTGHDAYQPQASPQRQAFEALAAAFPDTFTTVIGRQGPRHVWLALPVTALTDAIADAVIAAHHAQQAAPASGRAASTGEDPDA